MYILTLQGPTANGKLLLESWKISPEEYARLRGMISHVPLATTLTDADAKVVSQRFADEETA